MKSIDCVNHYLCMKDSMFSSDIQNDGHVHTLRLFILDVCTKYEHLRKGMWACKQEYLNKSRD